MAEKKEIKKMTEEERSKMLEGTLQMRDFTLGDFLNSAGEKAVKENSSAKKDKDGNKIALYQSGIADKEVITDLYVPMVAKFKEELGKADTQEKFNDVIDNFAKREIENITKEKDEILEELNEKTGKEYKSFKEVPEEDVKGFSSRVKKTFEEGEKIEKLLEIDNLDKMALRPSTYAFTKGTDAGNIYGKDVLNTLAETNVASFIENNETLKQKVAILNDKGEVKNQVVFKMVDKEVKDGEEKEEKKGLGGKYSSKGSQKESIMLEQPHLRDITDNIKVAVLNEVNDLKTVQTQELIAKRQGKQDELSYSPIESVSLVLSKGFEDRFKVYGEDREVDEDLTKKAKEDITKLKDNVSALFPKINESNSLEVMSTAKVASINPSLLKDKQEVNSLFAGEMVKTSLAVVRDLPDKVATYQSVTKAVEEKLNNPKSSASTKEFAQRQLDYIDAVKSGKKDEFLAQDKAEHEKKSEKTEKNSVEDAKVNQEKSEKEAKEEKAKVEEKAKKEPNFEEFEEFEEFEKGDENEIQDDEFLF